LKKIDVSTYDDPFLDFIPAECSITVFDLEFTAWEGSHERGWSEQWEYREIIQLGAANYKLTSTSFDLIGTIEIFVKPSKNKKLSEYITKLTGINDKILEKNGITFQEALEKFTSFTLGSKIIISNGLDGMVLRENCILNGLSYPFEKGRVVNVRPLLSKTTGIEYKKLVSSELPSLLGMRPPDSKHSALSDAKSVGIALKKLRDSNLI